jgi:hypothetical protein
VSGVEWTCPRPLRRGGTMRPSSGLCPAVSPRTACVWGGLATLRHDTPSACSVLHARTRLYRFSLHDSAHGPLLASLSQRLHPAPGSSPPQRLRVCQRVIAFAPVSHGGSLAGSPAARSRGRGSSRTSMPAGPSRCGSRPATGKAGPPLACQQGGGWAQWRGETWVGCWEAPEGGRA